MEGAESCSCDVKGPGRVAPSAATPGTLAPHRHPCPPPVDWMKAFELSLPVHTFKLPIPVVPGQQIYDEYTRHVAQPPYGDFSPPYYHTKSLAGFDPMMPCQSLKYLHMPIVTESTHHLPITHLPMPTVTQSRRSLMAEPNEQIYTPLEDELLTTPRNALEAFLTSSKKRNPAGEVMKKPFPLKTPNFGIDGQEDLKEDQFSRKRKRRRTDEEKNSESSEEGPDQETSPPKRKKRDIWLGAATEILQALKRAPNQTATCKALAKMLSKPYQKVRGNVRHLKGQGRVERVGKVRAKTPGSARATVLFLYKYVSDEKKQRL